MAPDGFRLVEASMTLATSPHRAFPGLAIIAGAATAVAMGLLTAGSVLSSTNDARARAYTTPTFSTFTPVVSSGPQTFDIVPSPVIDPNPIFFFGAGDGSAGYYAERPLDERQQTRSARTYESAL